jgi:23S rRNA A2030 N6-methylase RlmJ
VANIYFGDSGDVWKHLAFAQIVATEQPDHVWESHAGSAVYPLSHSPGRDTGVYFFREHVALSSTLQESAYARILRELETGEELPRYPGSPFLALRLLTRGDADFVFCDTDAESLADIERAASGLSIDTARLQLIHGDGVSRLSQMGAVLPTADAASTLVHIDPYDPRPASSAGQNAFDLLVQLGNRGIRCVLWAGYTTVAVHDELLQALHHAVTKAGTSAERLGLWCGDLRLGAALGAGPSANPDVFSSLVISSHVSAQTRAACDALGHELACIYETAWRADDRGEAIAYASFLVTNDP